MAKSIMDAQNGLLLCLIVILCGLLLFPIIRALKRSEIKKFSFNVVFKDFSKKMWMTVGLGLIFFGFYLSLIYLGSFFNDPQIRINTFFMVYKNPVIFVYLGLLTFACASTSIYLARMLIKYFYNKS